MKRSLRAAETPFLFPSALQRRLNNYALAASAAGVSMLALAQPADAKVVYTPVHQVIGQNGVYNLDLNHDGTVDFLIQEWNQGFSSSNELLADGALGNAIEGSRFYAAALQAGASIGPNQKFVSGAGNGEVMVQITHFTTGGTSYVHGLWANVRNRYLGLKFQIDGQTHYGWARVSVQRQAYHLAATLTGYAYETTPNTGIQAGQTDENTDNSLAQPNSTSTKVASSGAAAGHLPDDSQSSSLGELALGALTLTARRRQ
jgi:hypothetical protein